MIIGINGKIGAGKDTVGKIIQMLTHIKNSIDEAVSVSSKDLYKRHLEAEMQDIIINNDFDNITASNSRWEIKKFAGKTTESYKEITGVDYHSLPRELKEKEREKYKAFAQGCKSIFGEDVWVNALMVDYRLKDTGKPIEENNWAYCITNGENRYVTKKNNNRSNIRTFTDDGTLSKKSPSEFCHEEFYHKGEYPNWLITDVRFENEAQAILDKGGILIRINREPGQIRGKAVTKKGGHYIVDEHSICDVSIPKEYYGRVIDNEEFIMPYPFYSNHPSETALDNYKGFKYLIKNNGTIYDLVKAVRQILLSENIL